jgi:hypothetical protein
MRDGDFYVSWVCDCGEDVMTKIDDGGPAFPCEWDTQLGMNLRDHFASHALSAFMSWGLGQNIFDDYDTAAKAAAGYAKSSYLVADAMLKARGEKL